MTHTRVPYQQHHDRPPHRPGCFTASQASRLRVPLATPCVYDAAHAPYMRLRAIVCFISLTVIRLLVSRRLLVVSRMGIVPFIRKEPPPPSGPESADVCYSRCF